jgi:hypothetical protein
VFYFFPNAQNILKFFTCPQMAHLVLPDTKPALHKTKRAIFYNRTAEHKDDGQFDGNFELKSGLIT